jgi:hypothetical protein
VRDGAVVFAVPFITLAGEAGSDVVTVRTAGEALHALGYDRRNTLEPEHTRF